MTDPDRSVKVAIIGGGCGSIAAAFELSRPSHGGRYEVTVYQLGWRLGGKGASGRGPSGRIEEHGLHLWLGFYDNAFRLLRECYAELASDPGPFDVADWRTAFLLESDIGLFAQSGPDQWESWSACFPPREGEPGDPITGPGPFSLLYYIGQAIALLRTLILGVDVYRRDPHATRAAGIDDILRSLQGDRAPEAAENADRVLDAISTLLSGAVFTSAVALTQALALLQAALTLVPAPFDNLLIRLAEAIGVGLRRWLEENLIADHRLRHVWEIIDLILAIVIGTVRFDLLSNPRGLEAIDDYECRDWLRLNGASERAVNSPFVRGLYDLALAYEDGDPNRPGLAAGQALRGSLRMFFGYRGALFWRMRAGMGDVVFAPFYEVLRRRGVKFAFFHRLTDVRLTASDALRPGEKPYVTALEFDVQARIKGDGAYEPLITVNGRPCWPSTPDFDQLEDGEHMATEARDFESHWETRRVGTRTLNVVADFDCVVLGVSIGAIPHVCRDIVARDERWRAMVQRVKTVATQSFQIWLSEDPGRLGWSGPPFIASAFAKPFDTWCDMAHAVPEEAWSSPPRTAVYFCGVLPDPREAPSDADARYPKQRGEEVRRNAIEFLRRQGRHLWPQAFDAAGEFRWDLLVDAAEMGARRSCAGSARFSGQYWRANVNPSDRYVLALPGSLQHRISPLDMTYDNLTIAGDWTDCGFNEGCVEAAMISGRLAAHAVAGAPGLEEIVGYDHP